MTDLLANGTALSLGALGVAWVLIAIALFAVVAAFALRWYMNLPRLTHEVLRPDQKHGDE